MILGVSGHQRFSDHAGAQVRLETILDDLRPSLGLTSLAVGADQIFARALLDRGTPYLFIQPARQIEASFDTSDLSAFHALQARAQSTLALDFDAPSEAAYLSAGQTIVELADALVAVWDGKPAAGRGGTGDIVAYAQQLGKPVHVITVERES